jgi:hypothetical protein
MKPNGEYRVTRHKGQGPDSKNAKVFYSHLDEAPAMCTYRKSVPPKSGYVVAVSRSNGSLIAFTTGGPSNTDMTRTEAELERQLADAQTRYRGHLFRYLASRPVGPNVNPPEDTQAKQRNPLHTLGNGVSAAYRAAGPPPA